MSQLFRPHKGLFEKGGTDLLTAASTAITKGRVVSKNSNGYIAHAAAGDYPLYVAQEAKAATDTTTKPITLIKMVPGDEWVAELKSGTSFTQAKVGDKVDLHTDGTVDIDTSSSDDFDVIGNYDATHIVVSATKE